MAVSQRLDIAKRQINAAREYLLGLLDGLTPDEWFWMPDNGPTHIAWQVGHVAMAQYGLTLFRQRGRAAVDAELLPGRIRKRFMKGTTPQSDRSLYATPDEIVATLHRVHKQMHREIDGFDGDQLDEPIDPPYAAYATRYGALLFAGHHEMLHAGQIGLLRRLMGKEPLR